MVIHKSMTEEISKVAKSKSIGVILGTLLFVIGIVTVGAAVLILMLG